MRKILLMFTLLLLFTGLTSVSAVINEPPSVSSITFDAALNDNTIEWDAVYHNSRDEFYRNPGWGTQKTGAVPVGQDVTMRIRTAKDDVSSVSLRLWDGPNQQEVLFSMSIVESDTAFDYWETTVTSPSGPTDYYYAFMLTDGTTTNWYNDDIVHSVFEDNRVYHTGGEGVMTTGHFGEGDYSLIFHDPGFKTPNWHKQGVGYQIFIDRFNNGDPSNDPIGDGTSGDIVWHGWDSNGNGINDGIPYSEGGDEGNIYALNHNDWTKPPDQAGYHEFYGGDMQGVIDKVDYLADLGIDFIWFNPFSESADYHGYSVDDYYVLDANYGKILNRENGIVWNDYNGSMDVFAALDTALEAQGIKMIYDVVINHASAQGKFFQRFENPTIFGAADGYNVTDRFPDIIGAYENPFTSPYRDMFIFNEFNHDYDSWFNFKHIPTVSYEGSSPAMDLMVTGENNIFEYWLNHGVDGFRLDVNGIYRDGENSNLVNKAIRDTVKAVDPDAVIIGEIWERASQWLTGNMNDGTQNMPFRFNTIDWLRGNYEDALYTDLMHTIQENYPKEAFHSLWVNLGNHDRTRVRSALSGNINLVEVASTLQFGYPGVPVIWYGDETGMEGFGDPGTRGPYPWDSQNQTLIDHYKTLISIKKGYPVFGAGDFEVLNDSSDGVITFYRYLANVENSNALIIGNRDGLAKRVTIDLSRTNLIDGESLSDLLDNNKVYQVEGNSLTLDIEAYGHLILLSGIDEEKPDDGNGEKRGISGFLGAELLLSSIFITYVLSRKRNKQNLTKI